MRGTLHQSIRNASVFLAVGIAWMFFYVSNPLLSVLDIRGHEQIPRFVFLGLVPVVLACVVMFTTKGRFVTRAGLTLCVPILGLAVYFVALLIGAKSKEGLIGYWLVLPLSLGVYLLGVAIATAIDSAFNRDSNVISDDQPPAR
jgi:hypothetical protein